MLKTLKRKLILLNTVTTGLILTTVIFITYILLLSQMKQQNISQFQSHLNTVSYRLQSDASISGLWLSLYEAENHLLIHIEDNGQPFTFHGSWLDAEERSRLIDQARQLALPDGMDAGSPESSPESGYRPVFSFLSEKRIPCYGSVVTLPARQGFIKLTLVWLVPQLASYASSLLLLFAAIAIAGIVSLYFFSRRFVRLSIKPVEEGQKKQAEFIAAASHELRSPISVISTSTQALMLDYSNSRQFLPIIAKECGSMKRLIDDMLLLASSDADTWPMRPEHLDTDTFFIELFASFSPLFKESKSTLFLDLPDDPLPFVLADKQRLSQILGILLDNAASYSPEGSEIRIRPFLLRRSLITEVIDHGEGIPDKEKPYIFNRFYRLDKARTNKKHFGLGLSIAHELTALHRGRLTLSDTPGGGCTFRLELPLPVSNTL